MESSNLFEILNNIIQTTGEHEKKLSQLKRAVEECPSEYRLQELQKYIVGAVINIIKQLPEEANTKEHKCKVLLAEVLTALFEKTSISELQLFLFAFNYMAGEIFKDGSIVGISEEYKFTIVKGFTTIMKSLSWNVFQQLYQREYIPVVTILTYVPVQVAKYERLRSLRVAAMECLLVIAKVDDSCDPHDLEMRSRVADILIYYLPGIADALKDIALESEIKGRTVIASAVKTWGRIVALVTQDYNDIPFQDYSVAALQNGTPQIKNKDKKEINDYINNLHRTPAWYKEIDDKLQVRAQTFLKLTHHIVLDVRLELTQMCILIIKHCSKTIPNTVSRFIEILINLSEDESETVSNLSKDELTKISCSFSDEAPKRLLENLEDNFYSAVSALPRVFNSLDEREQLSSLNLLSGYMRLFGQTHLAKLLHSTTHLKRLIQTLIQFSELENTEVGLSEEYFIQDLEFLPDCSNPWKNFRYIRSTTVERKLENTLTMLATCDVVDITTDLVIEIFVNNEENRKEATFILNNTLGGIKEDSIKSNMHIIKNVVNLYLDSEYWNIPLEVEEEASLLGVKNNVIQICLQLEGLSKIATAIKEEYKQFLLKSLYAVLEKAGSGHPLIKAAGSTAIANISTSCGYATITDLINNNSDYFSYHVVRKIRKTKYNESALNVLTIVMKYSTVEVLQSTSDIIHGVLLQTCDKFFQEQNANAYLRVFQIFTKCLIKWFNIEPKIGPITSKKEKELQYEPFKISNLIAEENNCDDEETAEQMYKEDLKRKEEEEVGNDVEEFAEEYKEVVPPHIELAVAVFKRCLHFLPSKDRTRKLLTLEILKDGIEIIRDSENTLLPLVHLIWSPLVDRFKPSEDHVVINYSFQLLVTMARLSKDFIRSRTAKEVLPRIKSLLISLARKSYLQDTGSVYRYTQSYKLQNAILQHLSKLLTDLDLSDGIILEMMDTAFSYLSNKQPIPLQEASVALFCDIALFDVTLVQQCFNTRNMKDMDTSEYSKNVHIILEHLKT